MGQDVHAVRAERAGARADAALHAHLDPLAFLDVGLDFAQEIVRVLRQRGAVELVRCAHQANPFIGDRPILSITRMYSSISRGTRSRSVIATS
ncbi:hypothetical protein D3C83_104900 [compost metagenome]